jgi:mutator protein MutT
MRNGLRPVLAAVVQRGGRFLICKRPRHKRYGGLWEFPGGKILPGEDFEQAARRELSEELGAEIVAAGKLLFECPDPGSHFLIQFVQVAIEGIVRPLEHDELAWVRPGELLKYKLAPSDCQFARACLTLEKSDQSLST